MLPLRPELVYELRYDRDRHTVIVKLVDYQKHPPQVLSRDVAGEVLESERDESGDGPILWTVIDTLNREYLATTPGEPLSGIEARFLLYRQLGKHEIRSEDGPPGTENPDPTLHIAERTAKLRDRLGLEVDDYPAGVIFGPDDPHFDGDVYTAAGFERARVELADFLALGTHTAPVAATRWTSGDGETRVDHGFEPDAKPVELWLMPDRFDGDRILVGDKPITLRAHKVEVPPLKPMFPKWQIRGFHALGLMGALLLGLAWGLSFG